MQIGKVLSEVLPLIVFVASISCNALLPGSEQSQGGSGQEEVHSLIDIDGTMKRATQVTGKDIQSVEMDSAKAVKNAEDMNKALNNIQEQLKK